MEQKNVHQPGANDVCNDAQPSLSQGAANDRFFNAAVAAAKPRTYRAAVTAVLSPSERDDLYQSIMLDLYERAQHYDPNRGSAGTFTGMVSEHRTAEFIAGLKKDRARLTFIGPQVAANDDTVELAGDGSLESAIPAWTDDADLFADSEALHDLATALTYMSGEQRSLFDLLATHQDVPAAAKASGMSSATFYRRVADLQMHLRMFGIRPAA